MFGFTGNSGSYEDARREKEALARYLKETAKFDLSQEKTRITHIKKGFEFLRAQGPHEVGQSMRIQSPDRNPETEGVGYSLPDKAVATRGTTTWSLEKLLRKMNPILRGWANFYRFCAGAKSVLCNIDWYVGGRLWRWMRKKYPKAGAWEIMRSLRRIKGRRIWCEGREEQFLTRCLTVQRYRMGWMRRPEYALISGEPGA